MFKLLKYVFLVLPISLFAQHGPGGVLSTDGTTSLSLWLKPESIEQPVESLISVWKDASGYENHATALGNSPFFKDSLSNNRPALQFSSNVQTGLKVPHHNIYNSSNYMTVFVVGSMNSASESKGTFLVKAEDNNLNSGFGLLRLNSLEKLRFYAGDYAVNRDSEHFTYGLTDLYVGNYRTGSYSDKITTLVNNAGNSTSALQNNIFNNQPITIGCRPNNSGGYKSFLDGNISEIIVINENLPSVQRIIISNYLATKYQMGISNQKFSFFDEYSHNLIGIGKYGGVTHGKSSNKILTIEEDSDRPLQNSEFLMVADNGGTGKAIPTNEMHQFSQKLDCIWKAHVNGTITKETLKFNLANVNAPRDPNEFYLLLDLDGDNDFSNASIVQASQYSPADDQMVFEDVKLITGSTFTLAFSNSITWDGMVYENGSGPNQEPTDLDFHRKLIVYAAGAHLSNSAQVNSMINTSNGVFTIDSSYCFTVTNHIENNGEFIIEENASLIQLSQGKNMNLGIGTYKVKRTGIATVHGYNNWSSPVMGQSLIDLFPQTNHCDILTFSALIQNWKHDYAPNFQGNCAGNMVTFNAASSITNGDGIMDVGRGYFVPGNAVHPKKEFLGNVHNGDYQIQLIATDIGNNPNWNDDDWNFIGNPYPSALDPFAFWITNSVNEKNITDALYFWDDKGVAGSEYDQYNDYSAWNLTGGIASENSNKIVSDLNHIASGQGFFVWADTSNAIDSAGLYVSKLKFNNSMRSCLNSQFFKSENAEYKELVWLTVTAPDGKITKTLAGMVAGATDKKDNAYDARKPPRNPALSLATTIGNDSTGYMIQAIKPTNQIITRKEISLKLEINTAGNYEFKRGDFTKTNDRTTVYIHDSQLDSLHNIETGSYIVTLSPSNHLENRFKLVFNTSPEVNEDPSKDQFLSLDENNYSNTKTWYKNQTLFIDSDVTLSGNILIYDNLGRIVKEAPSKNQNEININLSLKRGLYLIKFSNIEGLTSTSKIVID